MERIQMHLLKDFKISDSEVVERVLSGEKELYEILMRRHNQKLYRTIRSYLKDEAEVEDAMQNTYLKAYEKLDQFHNNAQFSTWLIRIGINEALERLRKKAKTTSLYESDENEIKDLVLKIPDSKQMNPEHKAIQKEVKMILEKAIDKLPLKLRTIYMLHEIEEMSIGEISECVNISATNVRVRLHRAKSILKETLFELSKYNEAFEFGFKRCDAIVEKVMEGIS